jgi:hypothetical protein
MKKFTILAISLSLNFILLNSIKVDAQEVSLGYRSGYYLSHSVSLEKQISKNSSWELSVGHRFPGGLFKNNDQLFSRTGAIFNLKQFFHKKVDTSTAVHKMKVKAFWAAGFSGSTVKYDNSSSYINLGITGGFGVDFKTKKVITSLEFLPSYDLLNGNYKKTFVWYRATGISLRFIL